MKPVPSLASRTLARRTLLRGMGVALGLPLLDAMGSFARASGEPRPRRFMAVCTPFGIHSPLFFPRRAGPDYECTPYLEILKDLRAQFTVFSGVSHPSVGNAHASEMSFLTAAPDPGTAGFRNSISLDQFAVERLERHTRFPYLAWATPENHGLSWTANGVRIPPDTDPSQIFKKLFLDGSPDEIRAQVQALRQGRSVLDTVRDDARQLEGSVGAQDRRKLDQYFTALRELEQDLLRGEEWSRKPKPKVDAPPPPAAIDRADVVGRLRHLFGLARLAFQTDSTRSITLMVSNQNYVLPIEGVREGHHSVSHHGNDPGKLAQLERIDRAQLEALRDFLMGLKETLEGEESLLERSIVLYGSNLGNPNSHNTRNMPVLLAGGGFRHGQHLAFDAEKNYPLPNLFVSILQRLGLEVDRFVTGTGTMRGLELK